MQFSIFPTIVAALLPVTSLGATIASRHSIPSIDDLSDAQNLWSQDTSKVSHFLSVAETLSPDDLVSQASVALAVAKDEPVQKGVLDAKFVFVADPNPAVQQANKVLADQGTFQVILDGLQNLVTNGLKMSQSEVATAINKINLDRCTFVLPSIDAYFRATAAVVQNGLVLLANRPIQCPK